MGIGSTRLLLLVHELVRAGGDDGLREQRAGEDDELAEGAEVRAGAGGARPPVRLHAPARSQARPRRVLLLVVSCPANSMFDA